MTTKIHLPAILATCVVALAAAFPAAGATRPSAGAPTYLHLGPAGLCTPQTDWLSVDGIELDPVTRIAAVHGETGANDFLEVDVDGNGTATTWDDDLVLTLTSYSAGPPDVASLTVPLYLPGNGGGGWTTVNAPQELNVRRIEFQAGAGDAN